MPDIVFGAQVWESSEQLVEAREGAALISGDQGCHAMSYTSVALMLLDEKPGDGLNTRQQNRPGIRPVSSREHIRCRRPNACCGHGVTPPLGRCY
jgi:hypothetical protein